MQTESSGLYSGYPSATQEGQLTQLATATRSPEVPLDLATQRTYDSTYLTKEEAGRIVGLHPKTIEREIKRGHLRAFKPAGKIRIRPSDLDRWIESTALSTSLHAV